MWNSKVPPENSQGETGDGAQLRKVVNPASCLTQELNAPELPLPQRCVLFTPPVSSDRHNFSIDTTDANSTRPLKNCASRVVLLPNRKSLICDPMPRS